MSRLLALVLSCFLCITAAFAQVLPSRDAPHGTFGGRPFTEYCLIGTQNMAEQWLFYQSCVGAPQEIFPREFATLLEIWGSYGINPAYIQQTLNDALGKMREASSLLTSANANREDAVSQGSKAWSLTIKGNDIVEDLGAGKRYEVPADNLSGLARGAWCRWGNIES